MSQDAFLPADYTQPKSGGGFTKLETGDNTFRILSNPFMMWTTWGDKIKTSIAFKGVDNKPSKPTGLNPSVKHAWGLIVWNYSSNQIEVFELDKQGVIQSLMEYNSNPKWGHPKHYDIVINKKGSGKETQYSLVVEPKEKASQDIIDAYIANPVDLSQLLVEGGNPFLDAPKAEPVAAAPVAAPVEPEVKLTNDGPLPF